MEIRFELDDVALGKILGLPSMIIVTRFVFQKDNKLYPQVYLHECWYEFLMSYKNYAMLVQYT